MTRPETNRMVVRPGANRREPGAPLRVRWPPPETRRVLRAEGEAVPCDSYWLRRLRCGDVIEVTGPDPAAPDGAGPDERED